MVLYHHSSVFDFRPAGLYCCRLTRATAHMWQAVTPAYCSAHAPAKDPGIHNHVHMQEFLMASQNFTRSHSTGFDATSEAQINVNLHVTSLNRTGLTIQYQLTTSGLPLTSLSHTWKRTSAGLDLVSQYQIGNVGLGASFNQLVNCQVSRGDDPLVVAGKWQHHTVEEFGK